MDKARALLAVAKVDVTRSSLQIVLLYLVVEQARAAQQANQVNQVNSLPEPAIDEIQQESLLAELQLADRKNEKLNIEEAAAQADSPLDPAEAAAQLKAMIEEELQITTQARGLSADQVLALDVQDTTSLPQASTQSAESVKAQGSVQTGWGGLNFPDFKMGELGSSPMALLGGALFAGLAGGGGGVVGAGVNSVVVKAALYSLGIVADGYISGATVKLYAIVNGQEQVVATTTTNQLGQYQFDKLLLVGATKIVASGGTDVSTGLKFNIELSAPASATVVNPLTTLIQSYIEKNSGLGLTADQAMQAVKTALGITGAVNLLTVDPLAQAASSTGAALAEAVALQIKAAQIANVLVTGSLAVASVKGVSGEEAYAGILTQLVTAIGSLVSAPLEY